MSEDDLLLSLAAERAGLTKSGLRYAMQAGYLPAHRLGRYWIVRSADLDAWLADSAKHRRGRPAQPKPPTPKRKPGRPRKEQR